MSSPKRVVRLPGWMALPMPGLQRVSRGAAEMLAVDTHLRVTAEIHQVPAGCGLEEALTGLVQERVAARLADSDVTAAATGA